MTGHTPSADAVAADRSLEATVRADILQAGSDKLGQARLVISLTGAAEIRFEYEYKSASLDDVEAAGNVILAALLGYFANAGQAADSRSCALGQERAVITYAFNQGFFSGSPVVFRTEVMRCNSMADALALADEVNRTSFGRIYAERDPVTKAAIKRLAEQPIQPDMVTKALRMLQPG